MNAKVIQRPRIVITRSREGNMDLADRLRIMGIEPISVDTLVFSPPLDWSPVDEALRSLSDFDWVVFTSATGVDFFDKRMSALDLPLPWKGKPRVAAVGKGTSRALSDKGIEVRFVPSRYLTKSLGEELPGRRRQAVLLLRADIANPALSKALRERGLTVQEHPIYRTTHPTQETGRLAGADAVVFASPSAVDGFSATITDEEMTRLKEKPTFCIGPVTAAAARQRGFKKIVTPKMHTFDALLEDVGRMMSVA